MEVKINGKLMTSRGGSEFELALKNPMFSYEEVAGSKVYSIKVDDTEENRLAFGNVQSPLVRLGNISYTTEITRGNSTIEKGFSIIKDAKNDFDLAFTSNYAEIFGEYKNISLQEIDFGSLVFGTTEINASLSNTAAVNGWVLPMVRNPSFYESGNVPGGWTGRINDFISGSYTAGVKVPMFFVKNILNRIATLTGVTFSGDFFASTLFDKLLFYNGQSASANIEIRRHLPDMSIAQMLLNIRKSFNVAIRIDASQKKIRLDWSDDLLKQVPVLNWSNRFKRIEKGTPTWSDGIRLKNSIDSGDGLSKNAIFLPYEMGTNTSLGFSDIESAFSGMMMDAGMPFIEQPGIVANQLDKRFGNRLFYWVGGVSPVASNAFGGVVLSNEGRSVYFTEQNKLVKSSYKVEELAALSSLDIAQMAAIFKGENANAPIVHVWGNNYLIESIVVPAELNESCKVTMYRI